jgi:hypothetical protein
MPDPVSDTLVLGDILGGAGAADAAASFAVPDLLADAGVAGATAGDIGAGIGAAGGLAGGADAALGTAEAAGAAGGAAGAAEPATGQLSALAPVEGGSAALPMIGSAEAPVDLAGIAAGTPQLGTPALVNVPGGATGAAGPTGTAQGDESTLPASSATGSTAAPTGSASAAPTATVGSTNLFGAQAAGAEPVPPAYGEGISAPAGSTTTPGFLQSALDQMGANKLTTAGLGINAVNLIKQLGTPNIQKQFQGLAGPTQAIAQQLMSNYNAGQLNASDAYQIATWSDQAKAQTQAYYAKAGLSNSSMATDALAQIDAQANAMRSQALNNMLSQGLQASGIANQSLSAGITAGAQSDQAAMNSMSNFLGQLAKMNTPQASGSQQTQTGSGT